MSDSKRIKSGYLTFIPPGEHQGRDFIDTWNFSIDEFGAPPERARATTEVVHRTVAEVVTQRAAADAVGARRLIDMGASSTVRVSREDLLSIRRELMQSANTIDRALEVIDAWLDVRRSA